MGGFVGHEPLHQMKRARLNHISLDIISVMSSHLWCLLLAYIPVCNFSCWNFIQ